MRGQTVERSLWLPSSGPGNGGETDENLRIEDSSFKKSIFCWETESHEMGICVKSKFRLSFFVAEGRIEKGDDARHRGKNTRDKHMNHHRPYSS